MGKTLAVVLALLPVCWPLSAVAGQVKVNGARIWNEPEQTRIVVDTAGAVQHKIFALEDPHRLVVDLFDARMAGALPKASSDDLLVSGLRSGVRNEDDLRIVMDLKQPVKVKSFVLQPNEMYGYRLVVDLEPKSPAAPVFSARSESRPPASHLSVQPKGLRPRSVVIAVDAGHGGEDPGAVGSGGTREKDITLAVARKLASRINARSGMSAVLTRDGDYFVPLRQRIDKARKAEADLFVSIHADAFKDPRVRGSSVYTLSTGGATSEAAKWLAERENRADLIGGINLAEQNKVLAGVLLDMSQNVTIEHSGIAASRVLSKLQALGDVHQAQVQKAGFVVLKSPDIPSMLVETAFISNPDEEKRLRNKRYQDQLADSILGGIIDYFREYPPPGTKFAREPGERGDSAVETGSISDDRSAALAQIVRAYDIQLAAVRAAQPSGTWGSWHADAPSGG